MNSFWHDFLYTPLLNFLMFLYSGPAVQDLGVAIIMLTVLLRVLLLPFTLLDERNRYRYMPHIFRGYGDGEGNYLK